MKKSRVMSMLAAALMVGSITACGTQESAGMKDSQERKEAGGSVKIISANTGGKDEAEMKLFAEALSQATGLTVEIEKPASDYDKVLMQKLSGGETYDLIYVTASQYANLADQGALMDITDRVKDSEILTKIAKPTKARKILINKVTACGLP